MARERPRYLREIQVGSHCLVTVRRWPGKRYMVSALGPDLHVDFRSRDRKDVRRDTAMAIDILRKHGRICRPDWKR
jgi:hypothetical protein